MHVLEPSETKPAATPRLQNVAPRTYNFAALRLCVVLLTISSALSLPSQAKDQPLSLVTARNPDPGTLPTLGVRESREFGAQPLTMVWASFPNVPDFTCESWCYESEMGFVSARALDGGKLELRHRIRNVPALLVTVVTPEPGAVEFVARAEVDKSKDPAAKLPETLPAPNMCWQLRKAPDFASTRQPYPEFVKRCFIFTCKGRAFLDQTVRRKIPVRSSEDPYNNPPWVQMYVGTWQKVPQVGTNAWADYSPDRYTTPIIGAVSRDGKYLAAIGNDSAWTMAQAWHDCMHNNPAWQPAAGPPETRTWRLKIFVMQNDPDALLKRVLKDFPAAKPREGK